MLHVSNDRIAYRTVGQVSHAYPNASPQSACVTWLKRQVYMVEAWQAELLGQNANPDIVQSIETHKIWLETMIGDLETL